MPDFSSAIIMLAGLPGSGKTAASEYLAGRGFTRLVMGDVIRSRLIEKGQRVSSETMISEAKQIRKELGPAAVALLLVEQVRRRGIGPPLVIDGVRSLDEVGVIVRELPGCHVLAYVHASPSTRLARLLSRGRQGDPSNINDFLRRDKEEISFGLPTLMALSSYVLINEGPIEKLYSQLNEMLEANLQCSGELLLRYL